MGDGDIPKSLDDGEAMFGQRCTSHLEGAASRMHAAELAAIRHELVTLTCRDHVALERLQGGSIRFQFTQLRGKITYTYIC